MAYILMDALFSGIISNAPLMAVKAMGATDAQLQLPLAMTSAGLFASVLTGAVMARHRKKPFVLVPGVAMAVSALLMTSTHNALWFLVVAGFISIFDFAIRPAVPSILRIIYPESCRAHVAGTLRQYAAIVFLGSTLLFSFLLAVSGNHIWGMIQFQLGLAGVLSLAGFVCFWQLPDRGDGSLEEAAPASRPETLLDNLRALRDPRFCRYLAIWFLFGFSNLFYMGIVPAFFGRDLGYGYVQATLLIHVVPAFVGFLTGGRFTSWFDRASIWRSYAAVALLWGLDPLLLAIAPSSWVVVIAARIIRGPATVGSMVLAYYTGVHAFARPGGDTSRYMSVLLLVNGLARLLAPTTTALVAGHLSHRMILLLGGIGVLTASALFLASDETT
jgi:MFS family permease